MRVVVVRGAVLLWVHVVGSLAASEAHNERGHAHLNVKLDHVGDRVKLDVDELILQEHETNKHELLQIISHVRDQLIH